MTPKQASGLSILSLHQPWEFSASAHTHFYFLSFFLLFKINKIFQITFMQQLFPSRQLSEEFNVVLSFDCVWPYVQVSVWFYSSFTPMIWRTKENWHCTNIYPSRSLMSRLPRGHADWCVGRVTEPACALLLPSPNSSKPAPPHLLFTWWTSAGLSIWRYARCTQQMIIFPSSLWTPHWHTDSLAFKDPDKEKNPSSVICLPPPTHRHSRVFFAHYCSPSDITDPSHGSSLVI